MAQARFVAVIFTVLAASGILAAADVTGAPPQAGGTLRVALVVDPIHPRALADSKQHDAALDPQRDDWLDAMEIFRCCLARTLVSYSGRPTAQGGTILRPDLATALPDVSADELTWTFHIKPGLHYGPPLQGVEITSADVVRALEREARVGAPTASEGSFTGAFSFIRGFDAYAHRRANSISGLETPDPHTLRLRITRPEGDLANLFANAVTAPIPPSPRSPDAPYGAATGHDRWYGRYLASTGPYMIEGSDKLDLDASPADQQPIAGFVPARSLTLVRNPSWNRSTDSLRPALADRIELRIGGDADRNASALDRGKVDLVVATGLRPPVQQIARYQGSSALGRIDVRPQDDVRTAAIMNLAVPPFDDLRVRKAVSYAIDKRRLLAIGGGPIAGQIVGHVGLDSAEQNLLLGYDPYRSAGERGSVALARGEMRRSRYDGNHDGVCDAAVCRGVLALSRNGPVAEQAAATIKRDLIKIGIQLRVRPLPAPAIFNAPADPRKHIPISLLIAFAGDSADASNFFAQFSSDAIGVANYSLLGATRRQLRNWGYDVAKVPSVDARYEACQRSLGANQAACWSGLDQYLMTRVVPWVPFVTESRVQVIPKRLRQYSFDQYVGLPALDRIAVSAQ